MRIVWLGLILMLGINGAPAHDWYDFECCADKDCEETTAVIEIRGGYFVVETREWFGPRDPKVRRSRDQDYHRCRMTDNEGLARTRCLYVPQPGF